MRHAEQQFDFVNAATHANANIAIEEELDALNITLLDSYMDYFDVRSDMYGELGANASTRGKLKQYLAKQEMIAGPRGDLVAALPEIWDFLTDPHDEGLIAGWFTAERAPAKWQQLKITQCWEMQGYQDEHLNGYDGMAWYRTRFTVPEKFKDRRIVLFVGGLNNQGWFWVNGVMAGFQTYHSFWQRWLYHHEIDITDQVVFGKENELTVRVENDYNFGGIFRRCFIYAQRSASSVAATQGAGEETF